MVTSVGVQMVVINKETFRQQRNDIAIPTKLKLHSERQDLFGRKGLPLLLSLMIFSEEVRHVSKGYPFNAQEITKLSW